MLNTLPRINYLRITLFVILASIGFGSCEAGPQATDKSMHPEVTAMTAEVADLNLNEEDANMLEGQQTEDSMSDEEELAPEEQVQASLNQELLLSMSSDHTELADYLIAEGANPRTVYRDGRTLLHEAARFGNINNMAWLVNEYGLDVNARDNTGETPAHTAAIVGEIEAIVWLVNHRANIEAVSDSGRTAMRTLKIHYPNGAKWLQDYLAQLQQTVILQHNATTARIPNDGTSSDPLEAENRFLDHSWFHDKGSSF